MDAPLKIFVKFITKSASNVKCFLTNSGSILFSLKGTLPLTAALVVLIVSDSVVAVSAVVVLAAASFATDAITGTGDGALVDRAAARASAGSSSEASAGGGAWVGLSAAAETGFLAPPDETGTLPPDIPGSIATGGGANILAAGVSDLADGARPTVGGVFRDAFCNLLANCNR